MPLNGFGNSCDFMTLAPLLWILAWRARWIERNGIDGVLGHMSAETVDPSGIGAHGRAQTRLLPALDALSPSAHGAFGLDQQPERLQPLTEVRHGQPVRLDRHAGRSLIEHQRDAAFGHEVISRKSKCVSSEGASK